MVAHFLQRHSTGAVLVKFAGMNVTGSTDKPQFNSKKKKEEGESDFLKAIKM